MVRYDFFRLLNLEFFVRFLIDDDRDVDKEGGGV